ncbi:MAG: CAP domain-containing protein [Deltaproteobacteria bacterium]|nr:CAP domain-containing protein [Deltaproteobacteria bacterium]
MTLRTPILGGVSIASVLALAAAFSCYGVPEDETTAGDGSGAAEPDGAGDDDGDDGDRGTVTDDSGPGKTDSGYGDGGILRDSGSDSSDMSDRSYDAALADTGGKDVGTKDTGSLPCQNVNCQANAHCNPATNACECDPGFTAQGAACVPIDPGDPQTRTKDQMCDQWIEGHRTTASFVWQAGATECDPGTLEQAALDDALKRINVFRWLVGLSAVTYDIGLNAMNQKCAIMEYKMGYLSHQPDPSVPCYTQEGAQGAGSSNLALGTGSPAESINLFIWDGGVPSLGHRRWIFNPPFGPTGIGHAGNATCLYAFGMSGGGSAKWVAWPNPGYTPIDAASATWSWSASGGVGSATAKVTRTGDGADMPVTVEALAYGYGPDTIAIQRTNWQPQAGQVYRVELSGTSQGTVTYDVKPVTCP